jgi:hypothetical protein
VSRAKEPVSGLPLLFHQLRQGGMAWLFDRIRREWQMPTTGPGRRTYRALRRLRFWGRAARPAAEGKPSTLYAFYDLGIAPITFDFLWFLAGAEIARERQGLKDIHIVLVPGRDDGLRRERSDYDRIVDATERRARIDNILMPACALLPSVTGATLSSSREQAAMLQFDAGLQVFPVDYETGAPLYLGAPYCLSAARNDGARVATLRARASDLHSVEEWLAVRRCGGKIITITLRAYGYMEARNSNLDAWVAFARRLDRAQYSVVFVPDTDQVIAGLPSELAPFAVFSEAAINVGLRMALYERAFLNLGVNSGPMGLCWLNERTRYLTFKLLTPSVPQATPEYVSSHGFALDKSLPFATSWQKWVWEDDELPAIEREFANMVDRIVDQGASRLTAVVASQV